MNFWLPWKGFFKADSSGLSIEQIETQQYLLMIINVALNHRTLGFNFTGEQKHHLLNCVQNSNSYIGTVQEYSRI